MKQQTVLLAGFVGLLFGFLFAGTLGIDFFGSDPNDMINDDNNETQTLKKDEESFRIAYNLTDSIYVPISGDDVYDMIENGDTFIVYAGRDTCPYCQQYVPVLMEAAENQGVTTIYHIDTTDPLNDEYVDDVDVRITPTTYIYKDGVLVETLVGYRTMADTERLIEESFS